MADTTFDIVTYAKQVRAMGEAFQTVSGTVDLLDMLPEGEKSKHLDVLALLLRGMNCDAAGYAAAAYRIGQLFEILAERADIAARR